MHGRVQKRECTPTAADRCGALPAQLYSSRSFDAPQESLMSAETPEPLSTLLARVRTGDETALIAVLQQYETRLRLAAHALIGPALRTQMDTFDLVQSVHRALLPGLRNGKYDIAEPEQLVALALTVIRNKLISKWRHLRPEAEQRAGGNDATNSSRQTRDDPSAIAQVNDSVRHVLNSLDASDRKLLELRMQGYSIVEIADLLECDAHALRAHLSRLRSRLRDAGFTESL
jgi:RNA polymerase sigma factor (sigma-70 family)